jgi:hypothetical protein
MFKRYYMSLLRGLSLTKGTDMKKKSVVLTLSLPVFLLIGGCAHPLEVRNLDRYRTNSDISLDHRLNLGISAKAADTEGHRMIHAIGRNLLKYNINSTTVEKNDDPIDVLANISVRSENRGSGWNFWADFPGFLIWYPALNGYSYNVMYDIDVSLNDATSGDLLNRFFIPVRLDVRHADISRTWVDGTAWPTLGLSALIGGFPHMRYDESISPIIELETVPVLADYVAQQIATDLRFYRSEARERVDLLRKMLEEDLITQDEFDDKRREITGE